MTSFDYYIIAAAVVGIIVGIWLIVRSSKRMKKHDAEVKRWRESRAKRRLEIAEQRRDISAPLFLDESDFDEPASTRPDRYRARYEPSQDSHSNRSNDMSWVGSSTGFDSGSSSSSWSSSSSCDTSSSSSFSSGGCDGGGF